MMAVDDWQLSGDHLLAKMDRLGVIGERVHGARLRTTPSSAKHAVRTAKDLRRFRHRDG